MIHVRRYDSSSPVQWSYKCPNMRNFSCKRIYVNGTRLVIATGVCPYTLLQLNTNPSCPVLAVAIELVDYEAYKGFPYVSNVTRLIWIDFTSKDKSMSTVTRAFAVSSGVFHFWSKVRVRFRTDQGKYIRKCFEKHEHCPLMSVFAYTTQSSRFVWRRIVENLQ